MELFWLVISSFLPGLGWLYFFYKKDKYEPEPTRLVLLAFVYGALAIVPAGIIEFPFSNLMAEPPNLITLLLLSVVVVGITEEVIKFAVIRYTIYYSPEFNEVMDGVIYSISAGLGFATLENFLYAEAFGFRVGIIRSLITSLLHASFSGIMGYYLGRAKYENNSVWIKKGLLQVILAHGLYDFLVFGQLIPQQIIYLIVVVFYLYLGRLINSALALSPFQQD